MFTKSPYKFNNSSTLTPDSLVYNFFLATRLGIAIRCDVNDVRIFVGRDSSGVIGIKLKPSDYVVSMSIVNPDMKQYVLSVTENGFGKRSKSSEYRKTGRGGQGIANIEISKIAESYLPCNVENCNL